MYAHAHHPCPASRPVRVPAAVPLLPAAFSVGLAAAAWRFTTVAVTASGYHVADNELVFMSGTRVAGCPRLRGVCRRRSGLRPGERPPWSFPSKEDAPVVLGSPASLLVSRPHSQPTRLHEMNRLEDMGRFPVAVIWGLPATCSVEVLFFYWLHKRTAGYLPVRLVCAVALLILILLPVVVLRWPEGAETSSELGRL